MISKNVFLKGIEKLMGIFPDNQPSERAIEIYYETMSPDFTDEEFIKQLNLAVKNSFKFPPIAAFYRDANVATVYGAVTAEEREGIRRVLEKHGL